MNYTETDSRIPAAAITVEDAELLQRMQDRGTPAWVRLEMDAHLLPDAESANVVGEILGWEWPDEVVVVGGHIDSWDVGTGSTDDGGGCIVTWEALRIIKQLGLRPRRTLRVVLWTNEENGLRGATAYRDRYDKQLADHIMMLESDSGVSRPRGFLFTGNPPRARNSWSDCVAPPRHRRSPGRSKRRRRRYRSQRPGGQHPEYVTRR